jgi:hypothetical protein
LMLKRKGMGYLLTIARYWTKGHPERHHCCLLVRVQGCAVCVYNSGTQEACYAQGMKYIPGTIGADYTGTGKENGIDVEYYEMSLSSKEHMTIGDEDLYLPSLYLYIPQI